MVRSGQTGAIRATCELVMQIVDVGRGLLKQILSMASIPKKTQVELWSRRDLCLMRDLDAAVTPDWRVWSGALRLNYREQKCGFESRYRWF
ncbi:hypothetical protein VFPPC_15179 [Pochonia chlamydosporia 170]|uniref:Uncharacterized protein n=1 Tax=Pochonia chlamydosporia 170 TaxID=1380566 RepID=A0A179G693_METCM|nr:hypothetical protein VFPPC_15179 [Pochonia chlamydosporia 170]OAQ72679.1 hypothetical protein VFPPC_15179 [Pochonia chlamydosporia 170]